MSHNSARTLLVAIFGQLITVYRGTIHGRSLCRVAELFLSEDFGYAERIICEMESWESVIMEVKPEAMEHYDRQFDFFEPSYINRLSTERKARRHKQENSRRVVLPNCNEKRRETDHIPEAD